MIRELQFGDLEKLGKIPIDFPFPDISSGLYCSQKALFDGNKIVGSSMLKLTSEWVLILDPSLNSITKASLIREAFDETVPKEMDKFGLDQIHAFVLAKDSEHFADLLTKHFKFERARGIPLVYTKHG